MPGFAGTEDPIIANDITEFVARPSDRMVQEQRDRPVKPAFTAYERGEAAAKLRQSKEIITGIMLDMKAGEATVIGFNASFRAMVTNSPVGSAFSNWRFQDIVDARNQNLRLNHEFLNMFRLKSNLTNAMMEEAKALLPTPNDWWETPDQYVSDVAELTRKIKQEGREAGELQAFINDSGNAKSIAAEQTIIEAHGMLDNIGPVVYTEKQYDNLDVSEQGVLFYFAPTKELLYKPGPGEEEPK